MPVSLSSPDRQPGISRRLIVAGLLLPVFLLLGGCERKPPSTEMDSTPVESDFEPTASLTMTAGMEEDWPHWRGPYYNGSSGQTNLPAVFSLETNLVWQAELPGNAHSTPIIYRDHVFITSPDENKDLLLLCLDRRDGRERWRKVVVEGANQSDGNNNMSAPSPVTDGEIVVAHFGTGHVAAFDYEGNQLWMRNLAEDYDPIALVYMPVSSPLLFEGRLYLQVVHSRDRIFEYLASLGEPEDVQRESYLLCLDPKTGENLWRQIRPTKAQGESDQSYASPIPFHNQGRAEILVSGADCLTAHNPVTGEEFWRFPGLNPRGDLHGRAITSPFGVGDYVYVAAPRGSTWPMFALRAGLQGEMGREAIAWKFDEYTPDMASPLYYEGKLYLMYHEREQVLTCLDPASGDVISRGSLGTRWDRFRVSLTGAGGQVYCLGTRGTVVVLDSSRKFQIVHQTKLPDGGSGASIAVARGQLFIRTTTHLYCFAKLAE